MLNLKKNIINNRLYSHVGIYKFHVKYCIYVFAYEY